MKHVKLFENNVYIDLMYDNLYTFFNEISDKKNHATINNKYREYISVAIYLGPQDYIIKVSDGVVMTRFNVNEYYPQLYMYLKSKLPIEGTINNNKINYDKLNSDNITFSKKEYDFFKDVSKYNL